MAVGREGGHGERGEGRWVGSDIQCGNNTHSCRWCLHLPAQLLKGHTLKEICSCATAKI